MSLFTNSYTAFIIRLIFTRVFGAPVQCGLLLNTFVQKKHNVICFQYTVHSTSGSLFPSNICRYPGIEAEFFAMLLDAVQINYRVTAVGPSNWGGRLPNGTWTGLYTSLLRQEYQTVITFFALTPERIDNFTFAMPFGLALKRT